jgi:hypothetical protein
LADLEKSAAMNEEVKVVEVPTMVHKKLLYFDALNYARRFF